MSSLRFGGLRSGIALGVASLLATYSDCVRAAEVAFHIIAEDASVSLMEFGHQAALQILFPYQRVNGIKTHAVDGSYEPIDAVRLMIRDTGLTLIEEPNGVLVVEPQAKGTASAMHIVATGSAVEPNAEKHAADTDIAAPSGEATPPRELEEIVVTARLRTESLQNVPEAVAPISAAEIENNHATDLTKLGELAPQVMIGRHIAGTGAVITIRGISSGATDSGLDQSVAVGVDGVPVSRGRIVSASVFDMQQAEVLPGPQALYFGKNSPAGVISMHSADPTDHFEANLKAGYEFEANERFVEGIFSGPITNTLQARVAVRGDLMDGWIRNVATVVPDPFQVGVTMPGAIAGGIGPKGDDNAGRLTLRWEPSDDFNANLKLMLNQQSLNSGAGYSEGFCIGNTTVPTEMGVPMTGADCQKNQQKAESALPAQFAVNYPYGNNGVPYMDVRFDFGSLTLDKKFKDFSVTSTTGYYNQNLSDAFNADYSPFTQIYSSEHEDYKLLTEELRLNSEFSEPLNFMAGVYGEHATRYWVGVPDVFNVFNASTQSYITNEQQTDTGSTNYSLFAQVRWNIISTVELAAGARYSHDDKDVSFINLVNNLNSATGRSLFPQGKVLTSHYSNDNVSPDVSLSWYPRPKQTLYVAYKTGYKAGGMSNTPLLQATATSESVKFADETAKGFEIGYKADLVQGTLRMDLAAYRYDYYDLQVVNSNSQTLQFKVGNAAKALTEGATAELKWLATGELTLNGGLGYNRARYLSFPNAQCYAGQTAVLGCTVVGTLNVQNLSGKTLDRAPQFSANLGADYRLIVVPGWSADLTVNGTYSGWYQTASDYNPLGLQQAYWLLNAAVHVSPDNGKYRISLIGRDLTNSYYLVDSSGWPATGNFNEGIGMFNRPREVLLQAEYQF